MILFRKLLRNLRDYGTVVALKKSFFYFLAIVYDQKTYRIYKKNISEFVAVSNTNFEYQLKWMDKSNLDSSLTSQIEKMEEWLGDYLRRCLGAGGLCLCALDGPRLIGFNLVNFSELYLPNIKKK